MASLLSSLGRALGASESKLKCALCRCVGAFQRGDLFRSTWFHSPEAILLTELYQNVSDHTLSLWFQSHPSVKLLLESRVEWYPLLAVTFFAALKTKRIRTIFRSKRRVGVVSATGCWAMSALLCAMRLTAPTIVCLTVATLVLARAVRILSLSPRRKDLPHVGRPTQEIGMDDAYLERGKVL